jgi:hypothetical protein
LPDCGATLEAHFRDGKRDVCQFGERDAFSWVIEAGEFEKSVHWLLKHMHTFPDAIDDPVFRNAVGGVEIEFGAEIKHS